MERKKIILRLLFTHILLVPVLILFSFFLKNDSILVLAIAQVVLVIAFFTGYWEFFGLRFKWIYTIFMTSVIVLFFKIRVKEYLPDVHRLVFIFFSLVLVFLLVHFIKILLVIFESAKEPYELRFLFGQGRFLITDGGNSRRSRLMNYHYFSPIHKKNGTNRSMLYATDLVKLSGSKNKFLPKQNCEYPIYEENIYSPMDGVIFKVINGIPDNIPFSGNYPYNTGNTVVIKNEDYYFLLGHLRLDSIIVQEGEKIQAGQLVAKIGNSGWTERPHLHMQLIKSASENYWHGTGVPITYMNKNLFKNRIIDMPRK